jgi:ferredoxin
MRVIVNYDLCEANAVCVRSCPEVFRLEDDDTLTVLLDEIPEDLRSGVERAVNGCPRQALALQE